MPQSPTNEYINNSSGAESNNTGLKFQDTVVNGLKVDAKIFEDITKTLADRNQQMQRIRDDIRKANMSGDDAAARQLRKKYEEEFFKLRKEHEKEIQRAAYLYAKDNYNKLSAAKKVEFDRERKEELALEKAKIKAAKEAGAIEQDAAKERIKEINKETRAINKRIEKNAELERKRAEEQDKYLTALETRRMTAAQKKQLELDKKAADAKKKLQEVLADDKSTSEDKQKAYVAAAQAEDEAERNKKEQELRSNIGKALNNLAKAAFSAVETAMDLYPQYQGSINARLQGSGKYYQDISGMIRSNLQFSPYVKQQTMLENLNKLVEAGIAYNVEERAFLTSVAENIATTFDATNGTILRIVRLQQADSTAARLGMEASLTSFLNNMFQNTEYLTNTFKNVTDKLLEATSTMTRENSIAFEYMVQKWLGALESVGVSESTLNKIAEGIGYLGSGNIAALSSDTGLQNLMVMSANKAGENYADLLIKGLDSSSTNKLLKSMVEYLQEIAGNQNKVVRSAYGNVFGVSQSDLMAITNLTSSDISNIVNKGLDYDAAYAETDRQLRLLAKSMTDLSHGRLSRVQMMNTALNNVFTSMGGDVSSNLFTYGSYKLVDLLQSAGVDAEIPFLTAAGFGLDLHASIGDLVKVGIIGISALSRLGSVIGGLTSEGGINLSSWGGQDVLTRGTGLTLADTLRAGTSQSASVGKGSSSYSDVEGGSLAGQADKAKETQKKTGMQEKTPEKTLDDIWKLATKQGNEIIHVQLDSLGKDLTTLPVKDAEVLKVLDNAGLGGIAMIAKALAPKKEEGINKYEELFKCNVAAINGEGLTLGDLIVLMLSGNLEVVAKQPIGGTMMSLTDTISAMKSRYNR